jgi:hypothetical protein
MQLNCKYLRLIKKSVDESSEFCSGVKRVVISQDV